MFAYAVFQHFKHTDQLIKQHSVALCHGDRSLFFPLL